MGHRAGSSRQRRGCPRRTAIAAAFLLASGLTAPIACAAAPAARPLATLLLDLAQRTGTEIVSTEPGLRAIRVAPPPAGMNVAHALARLLRDTGYRAERIGPRSYRIVRAPAPPPAPPRPAPGAAPSPPPPGDIVVTASKQRVPLSRFPGTISTIAPSGRLTLAPAATLEDAVRAAPVLQGTALGVGRDKIFIRGIGDSSFNGSTQATTSYYFGDVPLGYSTPDPGLALVDLRGVEVMEGPQGTLYGAGAIGGVIRFIPNPVALDAVHASLATSAAATRDGGASSDVAGVLNLPLRADAAGLRLVGYRARDGGYIDDTATLRRAINAVDRLGGRATLRIDPGHGWRIEATALGQHVDAGGGQYTNAVGGALVRKGRLAEPYTNGIALGRVVVTRQWDDGLELTSASGLSHYAAVDAFDASPRTGPPIRYAVDRSTLLWTQETRLARSRADGLSWVVGMQFLHNRDAQNRNLGSPDSPKDIIGVTNVSQSLSGFGEVTLPVLAPLSLTAGLRATMARVDGYPTVRPRGGDVVRGRQTQRIDPTLALSWRLSPHVSAYARYQSGFRTGGLAVARGVGRVAEFRSDAIGMGEVGLRLLRPGATGVSLAAALAYARWDRIQADLLDRRGQPYTANIGNARILTAELRADWVVRAGLMLDMAALYTDNGVDGAMASTSPAANRRLPETPAFSGHIGGVYDWAMPGGAMEAGMTLDYVGRSVLGAGSYLDISQGDYATLSARTSWRHARTTISLTAENLTDSRANRFAFGNPFTLAARDQATPLRPRTIRLGFAYGF